MLGPLAIAVTAALIAALCRGDPKRRRSAKLEGEGNGRVTRWTLGIAALMPGVACLLVGDTAAFLMWIGGAGVVGWLVALLFARTTRQPSRDGA